MKRSIIRYVLITVAWAALFAPASVFCQTAQSASQNRSAPALNLLVLGDSILWGQGLRTDHKAWYQVKTWLGQKTGREVHEKVEAHSGAVMETANPEPEPAAAVDGEVNTGVPSVSGQVDRALHDYGDGSKVDLVLVSGCINDVGAQNLLNAASSKDELVRLTEAKCGSPMERLLRKITSSFPTAQVVVTGYYPFFSDRTPNDFFIKALTKRFYKANPEAPNMSAKAVLESLVANSKAWYQTSNRSLAGAVEKVNAELESKGSRERVRFAEIHFLPEHSFGTRETLLWGFSKSQFKRASALLSFGKVTLEPNDEQRKERFASCNEVFKAPADATEEQKKRQEAQRLLCRYASLGHPNTKGAVLYAEEIEAQLKSLLGEAALLFRRT